jgi:hypothetical protein
VACICSHVSEVGAEVVAKVGGEGAKVSADLGAGRGNGRGKVDRKGRSKDGG